MGGGNGGEECRVVGRGGGEGRSGVGRGSGEECERARGEEGVVDGGVDGWGERRNGAGGRGRGLRGGRNWGGG